MKFSRACERFLEHCRLEKGLSDHTLRAYRIDLGEFGKSLREDPDLCEISPERLQAFLAHMRDARGLKPATAKRRFAALKVLFAYFERLEVIEDNPFHRFQLALRLGRRLPRNLSKGELGELTAGIMVSAAGRAQSGEAHKRSTVDLAIRLILVTGIRVGELCAIQITDIDLEDASIRIRGKGNRERRVFLVGEEICDGVASYLRARAARPLAREHTVFLVNARGGPAAPGYIRTLLKEKAAALGLPRRITPHMLRHTAATEYLEKGVDIRYVQRLLGHASIATTEIYAAATDEGLRRALMR
ncbi:tyrosine-type recombinase/integrase [Nisaea acidiphila]|uniref:Tyrosine-type recombinase/integrase n=1 Tax=Nisaea acidiphila TaxID=1862145 RepID=A0A9J7AWZ7_9PROT|nr:tyrosine-type recombinase/integrase [Nisaea acidiphila]UUX51322.1 tyrosine-type recombinase/integrase [Nisaea acidiphila]